MDSLVRYSVYQKNILSFLSLSLEEMLLCEFLFVFFLMYHYLTQINEDLFGEVKFLSQTGPFAIPLKCTTKKCDVSFFSFSTPKKVEELYGGTNLISLLMNKHVGRIFSKSLMTFFTAVDRHLSYWLWHNRDWRDIEADFYPHQQGGSRDKVWILQGHRSKGTNSDHSCYISWRLGEYLRRDKRGIVEKITSIIDCIWVIKDLKHMAVHVKFNILTLFFIHL